MHRYRPVLLLILVMACVSLLVAAIAIGSLYAAALNEQRARLADTARSQARLMESVARFNQQYVHEYPGGAEAATLQQIEDAHRQYSGFGETGGFAFARRQGDNIVFLHSHRAGLERPKPVPIDSQLAEPMRRALRGERGTMIGADYLGTEVLAAYEPVAELGMGIVAKIDAAEVRAPFVRAALASAGAGSFVVMLGAVLFVALTNPAIRRLERSEHEFRTLAANVPALFAYVDADQQYRFVNQRYAGLFKRNTSEIVGMTVEQLLGPLRYANVRRQVQMVLQGEDMEFEIDLEFDDRRRSFHVLYVPDFDNHERVQGFFSLATDITVRKRAERDVARLAAIVESSSDAIISKNLDGVIQSWNDAAERTYGYSRGEVLGKSMALLMPPDRHDEIESILERIRLGERVEDFETVRRCKDGRLVDVSLAVSPIRDLDGRIEGASTIARDVTDRKEAREALRRQHEFSNSLIDTAQSIVLVLDPDGRIVRFNPYLERLTGWRFDEVRGRDWFDLFLPESIREEIRGLFGRAISGRSTPGNVNAILTRDGHEREIEWHDAPLTDADGELIGLLCTGLDVTERRLLQREVLEIAAEEQRRIGQELHDNTQQQLTGLSLVAQNVAKALAQLGSDPAASRHLREAGLSNRIEELARRAQQVQSGLEEATRQVNQLARGLIPVELDARGLMSSLTELAGGVSAVQDVECTFLSDGAIEVADNFAATHLYRIAQEAVNNAVKHSRGNRIEVRLSEVRNLITLKVIDNGKGIDQNLRAAPGMGLRIMEYRADLIGANLNIGLTKGGGTEVVCTIAKN
jgi:PAS domain S-box-containing protein